MNQRIRQFFFPSLTLGFFLRAAVIALLAYLLFRYICIPFRVEGASMEPTYTDGGFNFCWTPRYWSSPPKRHDVVAIRFAGNQIMLLKRVVALPGEEVEFREGKLWVNGMELPEPYVVLPCNWDLAPRRVEAGCIYVVGDNRSTPIGRHYFGQTSIQRILGTPLW